jgi:hypothetical protein
MTCMVLAMDIKLLVHVKSSMYGDYSFFLFFIFFREEMLRYTSASWTSGIKNFSLEYNTHGHGLISPVATTGLIPCMFINYNITIRVSVKYSN